MPFSGSGAFIRLFSWVNDAAAGIRVKADRMDAEFDGIATGLSNCITKDGQTTVTANLPMATKKHLNVGEATSRTDYARASQVIDGSLNWVDAGGTADAITASYSIPLTALIDGQLCFVRATAANATTTPTFSPSSLTARTIVKYGGSALSAGDIAGDGHQLILRYDLANTRWELLNPAVSGFVSLTANNTLSGNNTFTGLVSTPTESLLTISAGSITPTGVVHTLANESGAPTDNLSTITAGVDGQLLIMSPSDATDVTTIDETGNISINGLTTLDFSTTTATAIFIYRTAISKWVLLGLYDGASKAYVDSLNTTAAANTTALTKGAKLYMTTGVSQANNSWTTMTFDTEEWDDDGWHSTSSNTERITFDFTGRVQVVVNHAFNFLTASAYGIRIFKNGSQIGRIFFEASTSTEPAQLNLVVETSVVPTDYVYYQVFQESGGAVTSGTGLNGCTFSARRTK